MATEKWTTSYKRATGITAQSLTAGANIVSDTIDNSVNKDHYAKIKVVFDGDSAPTAGKVIEVYLLYYWAPDAEYGWDGSVDPMKTPLAVLPIVPTADPQMHFVGMFELPPSPFRVLFKSELNVDGDLTVELATHNLTSS